MQASAGGGLLHGVCGLFCMPYCLAHSRKPLCHPACRPACSPSAAADAAGPAAGTAAPDAAAAGAVAVVPGRPGPVRAVPVAVQEHEAGRLGGQDHRAVVWADEAIDALLDRSELEAEGAAQDAAAAAAAANDILAGFKVAHFELQQQPQEDAQDAAVAEEAEAAAAAAGVLASVGEARGFWETLLASQWAQAQVVAEEALGKGKRRRRQLGEADHVDQLDALLRAAELSDSDGGGSSSGRSSGGGSESSGRGSGEGEEAGRCGGLRNWCGQDEDLRLGGAHPWRIHPASIALSNSHMWA